MKTKIRFAFCTLAVAASAWVALRAADSSSFPATGHVLVLDNERILEGNIEHVGDQFRVRRTVGETWVPEKKAICLCADREEAYAYLRSQANLRDADERLRLARWCHLHGLRPQALTEVTAAVGLRPKDAEAQRLMRCLERSVEPTSASPPSPPAEKAEPAQSVGTLLDLSSESLGLFVTQVQPILMNTCASCHATGRGGAFKLTRVFENSLGNRRSTQQNVAAVMAQINREHAEASLLLTRAVSVHGESEQPPLKGRQTAAYRILDEWVQLTLADSQAGEDSPAPVLVSVAEPRTFAENSSTKPNVPPVSPLAAQAPAPNKPADAPEPTTGKGQAEGSDKPVDSFDPNIFNRQMHPSP